MTVVKKLLLPALISSHTNALFFHPNKKIQIDFFRVFKNQNTSEQCLDLKKKINIMYIKVKMLSSWGNFTWIKFERINY